MATRPEKKPASRSKRSKVEIRREFEDLQEEISVRETLDPKVEASLKAREDEVRAEVAEVGVEGVVQRIAGLGLDVTRALSEVAEKLTAEVRLLSSLREASILERQELERLHQIDIAATSIDHLVKEHEEKRLALEAELNAKRVNREADNSRLERERLEQAEALERQRRREVDDYEYRKALERKKAQDKYDEEQRLLARQNAERQETLQKDWQRREAALKEREEEIAGMEDRVAAFPACLAGEVEKARQEARREVEAQLERQMLLLEKDAAAEARVAQLSIKALEQQLVAAAGQIATLEKQLAEAKQQVQDIAVRAIEGASGARALSHINQIAMEQAKNRPQG